MSDGLPNNGMHLTALRAAGDAEAVRVQNRRRSHAVRS